MRKRANPAVPDLGVLIASSHICICLLLRLLTICFMEVSLCYVQFVDGICYGTLFLPIHKGSIVLKPIRTESIVLKLIYVKRALVREYAPIVEGASYLLQRLDSKVFNMDA